MIRLTLILCFVTAFCAAQKLLPDAPTKALPSPEQWQNVKSNYNTLNIPLLQYAESDMEQTLLAKDCYKFIQTADTTKFIAFFMQRTNSPQYKLTQRLSGRSTSMLPTADKNDSIHCNGYMVWGLKYEGKWYFYKDVSINFYDKNIDDAKTNYLFETLVDINFFRYKDKFWKGKDDNPFEIATSKNTYNLKSRKPYLGKPNIVATYTMIMSWFRDEVRDAKAQLFFSPIQDSIWAALHKEKPFTCDRRFVPRFRDDKNIILLNPTRSKALMPILYYDATQKLWLTYYLVERNEDMAKVYLWKKFPLQEVVAEPGHELNPVTHNLETFIPGWLWPLRPVIKDDAFWNDNFNPSDLQPINL